MKVTYFILLVGLSFVASDVFAQSFSVNNNCPTGIYNVSINEAGGNIIYNITYAHQHNKAVEKYLIKKLGKDYNSTGGVLKTWIEPYRVISNQGHISLSYNGNDKKAIKKMRKLSDNLIDFIKSENG